MWFLPFLPSGLLFSVIVLAVIVYFLVDLIPSLPVLSTYKSPIRIFSVVALCFSLWAMGARSNNDNWLKKESDLKVQIAQAEARSASASVEVVEKLVYRTKVIKEHTSDTGTQIEEARPSINANCVVPDNAWVLYNNAVHNQIPERAVVNDGASSSTDSPTH